MRLTSDGLLVFDCTQLPICPVIIGTFGATTNMELC